MPEKLEDQILKIIKEHEGIWISELYRELIKKEKIISYQKLLEILSGFKENKIITFEEVGKSKVIRLVKNG